MRYKIFIATLILVITINSCKKVEEETKTLDFESFTIQVPGGWEKVRLRGIDSYVGQIALDETDTISFDLGWYSNDLTENPNFEIRGDEVYVLNEAISKPGSLVYDFVGKADSVQVEKFLMDSTSWITVDNKKAKLVQPKKPGLGTTGVYIDSLWKAGSGIDKFQMSGRNLKPDNERRFLQAIRTLRFKRK